MNNHCSSISSSLIYIFVRNYSLFIHQYFVTGHPDPPEVAIVPDGPEMIAEGAEGPEIIAEGAEGPVITTLPADDPNIGETRPGKTAKGFGIGLHSVTSGGHHTTCCGTLFTITGLATGARITAGAATGPKSTSITL